MVFGREMKAAMVLVITALAVSGCGGGGGGASTSGTGGGGGGGTPPVAPTGLVAQRSSVQTSQMVLTWSPSLSSGVIGYNIYRKLARESSFSRVASSSIPNFVDTTVSPLDAILEVDYRVTAVSSAGESPASNTAIVPDSGQPPPPPF